VYQDGDYLYPGQYSRLIADWILPHLGVGTFSWQNPVHFFKAGPGEVMNVEIYHLL
jgi:hypothetical protein